MFVAEGIPFHRGSRHHRKILPSISTRAGGSVGLLFLCPRIHVKSAVVKLGDINSKQRKCDAIYLDCIDACCCMQLKAHLTCKKLCRWQQKCYRSPCPYIYLPQDILETARRPYRLCWAHLTCKYSKCPFIHYSVDEASPPLAPKDANPNEKVVAVPSHLPQSYIMHFWRQESTEDDNLHQRIERMHL